MSSIFTSIIKGDIPSYKIYEDEDFYAFLDINPVQIGHTLLVPKMEMDKFFDLSDSTLSAMMPIAKKIAQAIEEVIPCLRVGVAVVGLEVPHAHMHLIPLHAGTSIDFGAPKKKCSEAELRQIAGQIEKQVQSNERY